MTTLGPFKINEIHQGDALSSLKLLLDNCIDAIITDPVWPNAMDCLEGSDRPFELFAEAAREFPRIAKRVSISLGCNSDPRFLKGLPSEMPFFRVCWLDYARPHYLGRLLYTSDVVYLYGEPPKSIPGRHLVSGRMMHNKPEPKHKGHPCPRRLSHMKWILEQWTRAGEIVLDPFAGIATTAVACIQTGRRFLGFEIVPEFCNLANERIKSAQVGVSVHERKQGQQGLFDD